MQSLDLVPIPESNSQTEFSSQAVLPLSLEPSDSTRTDVSGIDQRVISNYFQTLNRGDFGATSQLFAIDGVLQPPFDAPVIGPEAIATYLETEATGLVLQPQNARSNVLEDGCTEWQVTGKVQTPFFSVNVVWQFILSPTDEIFLTKVKLLASLQELFQLRQKPEDGEPA